MRFLNQYKKSLINHSWVLPFVAVGTMLFCRIAFYLEKIQIGIGWCILIGIIAALAFPMIYIENSHKKRERENGQDEDCK